MCGLQVKPCDPLVTHGPCLNCIVTLLRDSCTLPILRGSGSFMLTVIVAMCLQFSKTRLLLLLSIMCRVAHLSLLTN